MRTEKAVIEMLMEALNPPDRLGAGLVIYRGYVPENVVDLVHCLNIALSQLLERQKAGQDEKTRIRKTKVEIDRLQSVCRKALLMVANGK